MDSSTSELHHTKLAMTWSPSLVQEEMTGAQTGSVPLLATGVQREGQPSDTIMEVVTDWYG